MILDIAYFYFILNTKQTKKIISEWTKRSSTIGKNVELETRDGKIKGKAIKIDEDGALIVSDNNKINRIIAGDIVHLSK